MKLSADFSLGRAVFYPSVMKPDGKTRRKAPFVRLYLTHQDAKEMQKLLKFCGTPASATPLQVHILSGLVVPGDDGEEPLQWVGYANLGRATVKPPTGDRAKEAGAELSVALFLTFPEHTEHDLDELLSLRVQMALEDSFIAKLDLEPAQNVLFTAGGEPEPEAAGQQTMHEEGSPA